MHDFKSELQERLGEQIQKRAGLGLLRVAERQLVPREVDRVPALAVLIGSRHTMSRRLQQPLVEVRLRRIAPEPARPRRFAALENSNHPKYSKNPTYVERSTYSYNRNEDH